MTTRLERESGPPIYRVRMGMGAAEAEPLAEILLRCPADVAGQVHDQLWLRAVLVLQRRRVTHAERATYDARADRILAQLDPAEDARAPATAPHTSVA